MEFCVSTSLNLVQCLLTLFLIKGWHGGKRTRKCFYAPIQICSKGQPAISDPRSYCETFRAGNVGKQWQVTLPGVPLAYMNVKLLLWWVCKHDYHIIAAVSSGRIWVRKICKWVGCWGSESNRKVWVRVYFACIWTQPGILIYWPAQSRDWGWKDESLYVLQFFSFWAIQLPMMHQFLKWDSNLQYFRPFNEDLVSSFTFPLLPVM